MRELTNQHQSASLSPDQPVVEMCGIVKKYPGVVANQEINFFLEKQEIHALLGENGAGKTTLMNILYGLVRPDAGSICIRGKDCDLHSPSDAIRMGIGKVHQRPLLIDRLTVAENIFLGQQEQAGWWANNQKDNQRLEALIERYGFNLNPSSRVWTLSPGECQRVEILKSLIRQAEILILDEPTSVLTPAECKKLFQLLHAMVVEGLSIIYISHKLDEVIQIADRATMLRDGEVIATVNVAETTKKDLACMMVGREVLFNVTKAPVNPGDVILEVKDLKVENDLGECTVNQADFSVRCGEILGIAGVSGSGQLELSEALAGLREPLSGEIKISGESMAAVGPDEFLRRGVGFIPENISRYGVAEKKSIKENALLKAYLHHQKDFLSGWLINTEKINEHACTIVEKYDVRTPDLEVTAGNLSGGNLHKLVLGRELHRDPLVLIASQPTKGLDVAATEYIYEQLLHQRDQGRAVVLISDNLDEILQLSDRVAVMYEGKILAVVSAENTDPNQIGLMIGGVMSES
jgi:ABC-type uncharacterized transport system ATPase subunit